MLWSVLKHTEAERVRYAVAFLEPEPVELEVRALGERTFRVPTGRLREPLMGAQAVRRLSGIIRDEGPDLVLNWLAKAQLYGATAAVKARRADRVVWCQHGMPAGHWMDRVATALPARAVGCSSRASANEPGVTGCLVDRPDPPLLASAMCELIGDDLSDGAWRSRRAERQPSASAWKP